MGALAPAGELPPEAPTGLEAITASGLRGHLRFLADDLLEGRRTGTRGHRLAARYVAAQLAIAGFAPAGTTGWEQPVPLRRASVDTSRSELRLERGGERSKLKPGEDYLLMPRLRAPSVEASGEVVYVGYGLSAPSLGYDDYADVDVRGRIVALLAGAPDALPADLRAHFGSSQEKARAAEAGGAVGMLFLQAPEQGSGAIAGAARSLEGGQLSWHDAQARRDGQSLDGIALLGRKPSRWLFERTGSSLEEAVERTRSGRGGPLPLGVTASLRTHTEQSSVASANVVGRLAGSDPALGGQAVVYTAHLDHLGVTDRKGDGIYNGALDNASGVAAILQIARAFGALPRAPRRSIVMLATTAEEAGLLGSEYFVAHPTLPLADIVADVNVDLLPLLYPARGIVAHGADRSTLMHALREAATHLGLEVEPDPWPEQSFFVRSDQYSFVRRGIPSLFLAPGLESADPEVDGEAVWRRWMRERYHTPKDDLSQDLDYEAGAVVARLGFLTGLLVAEADERPRWNPGEIFDPLLSKQGEPASKR